LHLCRCSRKQWKLSTSRRRRARPAVMRELRIFAGSMTLEEIIISTKIVISTSMTLGSIMGAKTSIVIFMSIRLIITYKSSLVMIVRRWHH
jgi:hypothetical protein